GAPAIPEARRYALEFEMFLLLTLCEVLRTLSQSETPPVRFFGVCAALTLAVTGWGQMRQYITQGARGREPIPFEDTIEFRLAKRIEGMGPRGRVYASGGLRFRMNSWQETPQIGGVFESGLRKRVLIDLAYQVRTGMNSLPGREGQDALARLKVLGAEYLVVHGIKSREHYRDYKNPEKFAGLLTPVYTEEDDIIYSVPFRSLAHLVKPEELPPGDAYVLALSDEARPKLAVEWRGPDALHIEGPVAEGRLVTVLVNYDAGWRASQDGKPVNVEEDKLGFLLIRADPSPVARIALSYHGTTEQRVMGAASLVIWLGALAALWWRRSAS
ncbi:MAG: hypothetical protein ABIZ80_19445, partial [Bryobacteraceae bacterium]